ncbi:stage III sporulation protein AG [Oscillospiraceae bacterium OttesenSCG-928-G22]|nr:stage III sporulation protein AG [Oscillospiraceae bacterium OttesenSCG-928-G22]
MEIPNKIKELFGKYKYVLIVILAGVLLILLPTAGGGEAKTADTGTSLPEFDLEAEEERITKLLSNAEGVGKVDVMLSLASTMETMYFPDEETKSARNEGQANAERSVKTVTVPQAGGGQEALVYKRIYPEYKGALVVCEGAGNASVRLRVVEAVASLTGLTTDKITVIAWEKR